jgi:hypothetical protein
VPRSCHASCLHDNKLWVAGGFDKAFHALSSVEVLDLSVSNKMEKREQSMVRERAEFSLVECCGELYAVGGDWSAAKMSIEKLEEQTGAWQLVCEYDGGGGSRFFCACAASGSRIYVFGGSNASQLIGEGGFSGEHIQPPLPLNDTAATSNNLTWDSFDIKTGEWASKTLDANIRRLPRGIVGGRAVAINGFPTI